MNPSYIQHQEVVISNFASKDLFEIAKELTDKKSEKGFLIHFENHLNEIPCSFRKHGFKIIQQSLQAQYDKDLCLDFDKTGKREEKSALDELFLGDKITSQQNADFETMCENMRSYFKAKSHIFPKKTLEWFVCAKLADFVEVFYASIKNNDPEQFHKIKKREWLNNFNIEKANIKQRMVVPA